MNSEFCKYCLHLSTANNKARNSFSYIDSAMFFSPKPYSNKPLAYQTA
jgi:hypothetical protein